MQRNMNTGVEDTRHTSDLQRQHERAMEGMEALVDKSNSALRELETEQRDHAEAINNLMDMLEKTATHEDLEQAMDQQYEDLLERSKLEALELVEENILKIEEKVKKAAHAPRLRWTGGWTVSGSCCIARWAA